MSGGAYNYTFEHVREMAEALENREKAQPQREEDAALRLWFVAHLKKVAAAMKAVEWVDSGDSRPETEEEAIYALIEHAEEWNEI